MLLSKVLLCLLSIAFICVWFRSAAAQRSSPRSRAGTFPTPKLLLIGFITDFLDTLGIGSYAPTTSLFKFTKSVDDRLIPGTMTIGHMIPTLVETLIYLTIVPVDPTTLFSMLGSAMLGAWMGAGVVSKLSKRAIQIGMTIALSIAVILLSCKQMGYFPGGGDALGVTGIKLGIAVGFNFVFGALMTIGIGMYAPCMIVVYLLGMSPTAAFPIMMGSCAFLMPVGALPFLKEKSYDQPAALGLTLGGIPGVLLAAYVFYQLSIRWVLWLVIAVSVITAVNLFRSVMNRDSS
ncbi:MAG: sulfite exporter TauE/SafE family protein [Cryobacterium sp.]|nr:sulfite exporter TauE/SafE family protein [Oligoflexia bacterium]